MRKLVAERGGWDHLEILIVENNSKEEETFRLYKELQETDSRVKCVTYEGEFDYAAINNFGVRSSDGEYILFLNNDTEVISDGAVRVMMKARCVRRSSSRSEALFRGQHHSARGCHYRVRRLRGTLHERSRPRLRRLYETRGVRDGSFGRNGCLPFSTEGTVP